MAVEWQFTPVLIAPAVSTLIAGGLALYAARAALQSDRTLVLYGFVGTMVATGLWSLLQVVVVAAVDEGFQRSLFYVLNLVAFTIPPLWLFTALAYADRTRWLTRRWGAAFATLPAAVLVLTVTSPAHGLLLADAEVVRFAGGAFLDRDYGTAFTVLFAVGAGMVLAGIGVLLRWVRRSGEVYRGQAIALVAAVTVPITADAVYVAGLVPNFFNPTPLSFSVSGTFLAVAIFRYRLLDVVPIARNVVVERMRDGYVVLDPAGTVVDLNPAARSIVGPDPIGRPATAVFGEAVDLDADEPGEMTVEGDDRPRSFEVHVSPLAEGGRDVGRVVSLRDVTDRRRVERRYQALFEQASDVITVLNADGTVAYLSPSVERVLGYDPDALVGENVFEYVHPDDRDDVVSTFEDDVENPDGLVRLEYRFRNADGEYRVVESVGRNLLDTPAVGGLVVNSRDVTERVERQRELEAKNERLDEFASLVSHDLRNPLGVAKGHLDMAAEDPETHLPEIRTSLERMEAIVDDVLALSRESDPVEETERVDLGAVARNGWRQVDTDGATLSVSDSGELDADPDRLQQLLENLFRNSVEHGSTGSRPEADDSVEHGSTGSRDSENPGDIAEETSASSQSPKDSGDSVEHGSTGSRPEADDSVEPGATDTGTGAVDGTASGPTITVGTTDAGFYVADDGPGIPPEERDRIFESGYTTATEGTGFGLAIVDRIATAHGWSVAATEAEDGGARFEVETP